MRRRRRISALAESDNLCPFVSPSRILFMTLRGTRFIQLVVLGFCIQDRRREPLPSSVDGVDIL